MIQYRRLAALVLGAWLGAAVFADIAATQNFAAVDRFLAEPGSLHTSVELNQIGRSRERLILRRNAGEENNGIFENWERAELIAGTVLFALLLFGARPNKMMLGLTLLLLAIVAVQHFYLSPQVTDLGRRIADVPASDPLNAKFRTFHGVYSGSELLKLVVMLGFAARLAIRRKMDPDHFVKEFDTETASAVKRAKIG